MRTLVQKIVGRPNRLIPLLYVSFFVIFSHLICPKIVFSMDILSKSRLEKCEKGSNSDNLNCTRKIVLNIAVPSGSSGGEASIVAEIAEAEEKSSNKMETLREPPVLTVNKSATYALYELTYIRDVPYKPQEYYVRTRKCEPDSSAYIVKICERLRDQNGHIIEYTQPTCCPCGNQRRMPSSCGNFFDKMMKGKANTAHCLRFPGDWFHVFGIGRRSIGFNVKIEVKTGSKVSELIISPSNRTATSSDNFLKVSLVGEFGGYTNIPTFEDFYLAIPKLGVPGQPPVLGRNFSMWMLLERMRFTLDGQECNKIGVGYQAFNEQLDFCAAPFWSCLHNQLWNFWEADRNRRSRNQSPLYTVEGRFERINQHPNAGTHTFSIGVTEVLNSDLMIELAADDIEYVFQRSPGKILGVTTPTFEALTQFGVATVTAKNIGEIEASYSLTFDCFRNVSLIQEQFFIMKAQEITNRSFKVYPSTDQAAKYACSTILKGSDFHEVDRADCQFTTTATVPENGSLATPFHPPKSRINGFFASIEMLWRKFWAALAEFITGKHCRSKCSGFLDLGCHIQYICLSWVVLFGLFVAIFPTVAVLLWLLHQKGLFDPLYDWWEDHILADPEETKDSHRHRDYYKHRKQEEARHLRGRRHHKHRHRHHRPERDGDYYQHHLHHAHMHQHKARRSGKSPGGLQQLYSDGAEGDRTGHHRARRHGKTSPKLSTGIEERRHHHGHRHQGNEHGHGHGDQGNRRQHKQQGKQLRSGA